MRDLPIIGQPQIGAMEIKRPPKLHKCGRCSAESTLILPQWPGVIVWRCKCGQNNRFEFGSAEQVVIPQMIALKVQNRPILHECDECGIQDYIVLPSAGGELRWTCKCGTVWSLQWTPERWMRGKVMQGHTVKVPTKSLCGCGLAGCPHCGG